MEQPEEAKRFCAFCLADRNLSKEHVWSEWVRGHIPHREDDKFHYFWAEDGEITRVAENLRLADIRIRRVCESCNTGWMARIEEDAIPVLSDLVAGNPRTLDHEAMTKAAAWGYLKCLVVDLSMNGADTLVVPVLYPWVRESKRPPDSAVVSIACYGGNRHPLYAAAGRNPFTITLDTGGSFELRMYSMTIGIGHLVIKVVGHHLPVPVDLNPAAGGPEFASRIWPQPNGTVRWPPGSMLTDSTLKEFARRY